jgi:YihY family inner membrane protein
MNDVWDVPLRERPNFWFARARSLVMLAALGVISVVGAVLAGVGASGAAVATTVTSILGSTLTNFLLFLAAFKVLTAKDVSWSEALPGAIFAAVVWEVLELVGGYYVSHQLQHASAIYGSFAVIIGLLSWLYLGAQITIYAVEINVIKSKGLWPRSLLQPPLTDADERVLRRLAKMEERRPEETVDVSIQDDAGR